MRPLIHLLPLLAAAAPLAAEAGRYRLTWRDDPATTVSIIWDQVSGDDPAVHWDVVDHGQDAARYANRAQPELAFEYRGMQNRVVRLTGLQPDTLHYFVVADSGGVGRRLVFRTAPAVPKPFTFVEGGDSRDNPAAAKRGNVLVAKLRPLFVLYGGDYTSSGSDAQWRTFFDTWQASISDDGRIYPIVATRGNHENDEMVHRLFDTPHPDNRFALDVAGALMRVRVLNSELPDAKLDAQDAWLREDFAARTGHRWKVVAYHKPMRPHTIAKVEGDDMYVRYARLFHEQDVHLAMESDTHMCKLTYPLRPDDGPGSWQGFVRDDANGTVYIGEGSWGAPRRPADDDKPWTMASGSFFQLKWIHVHPDEMLIRTVTFDGVEEVAALGEDDVFRVPEKLPLWRPPTGEVLRLPFAVDHPSYGTPARELVLLESGIPNWFHRIADDQLPEGWRAPGFVTEKKVWKNATTPFGLGCEGLGTTLNPLGGTPVGWAAVKVFAVPHPLAQGWVDVRCNAGVVLHLDGIELARFGLPDGGIGSETLATAVVAPADAQWRRIPLPAAALVPGIRTLAVGLHRGADPQAPLFFDLRAEGVRSEVVR